MGDSEKAVLTPRSVVVYAGALGAAGATLVSCVLYIASLKSQCDLIAQRQALYEAETTQWRTDSATTISQWKSDATETNKTVADLVKAVAEFSVEQRDMYQLIQKIDAKVNK